MLRPLLRDVPQSLRATHQPAPAWNGAWRRLFTSRAAERAPAQAWGKSSSPMQALWRRAGYGGSSYTAAQSALRGGSRRGFRFSAWRSNQDPGKKTEVPLSLAGRLKKLSREYGWSAVGVYAGLSILDFPFCFLIVRIVGADKIGKIEHWVVSNVKSMIPDSTREWLTDLWYSIKGIETKELGDDDITDKLEMVGWGVEEAQERNKEEASLGTQLALAYAIHKSFIFVRVPLTAAVTPKVVKVLRGWGWNIGKRTPKAGR